MESVLNQKGLLDIDVVNPVYLDSQGKEIREEPNKENCKSGGFKPFIEETIISPKKKNDKQSNSKEFISRLTEWAKDLPNATS